jgi:hypothetical protein
MNAICVAVVRPSDDPRPRPHHANGERRFAAFLKLKGWRFLWEPDTFHGLPPATPDGAIRAFTPDVKLLRTPRLCLLQPVYLELTEADRYDSPAKLPARIKRKNLRSSLSGQPYISPAEYLARKRDKIALAEQAHPGLRVILVPHALQQEILADPALLERLVEAALVGSGRVQPVR